ncbi:UNVERIFIED_CONTAM: hypothetical protein FKN15_028411 [Acipenser sinensis]
MKRPKLKKASKRLTCSKRYKIQKKVREHNKKLRKEAKKQKVRKVKKDPGIPNAAPFKEEILREAEHRKLQLEELKEKQKLTKQKERAKKRKREAENNDPATKAKKAKKEQTVKKQLKSTSNKDKNSKTLFCSELKKVIEASDVILEVLDARDPLGCRCPQVEETILNLEGKKKLILVLNKIDLVPKDNVEKWLKYLQNEFPTVAFKASTQLQDKTVVCFCLALVTLFFLYICVRGKGVGLVKTKGELNVLRLFHENRVCWTDQTNDIPMFLWCRVYPNKLKFNHQKLMMLFFLLQQKKRRAASGAVDLTKGVTCLGSDFLSQLLGDYYRSRGTDDAIKVGVVDLVPKDNVEKWLKYLQNEFPTVAFKASTQLQDKTVQQKKRRAASGAVDLTKGVTCLGSDFLSQLLGDYYRSRGTDDAIKVGVVGFPNVGKSSLINSMKKMRACHVGISRCTTRCMQLVHIDKSVKMLDSPGIIAGSLNSAVSLALRSASEMEELVNPLEAVNALLKHCNKQQVMLQYNIPNYRNSLEFLTLFAMKRGCLKKGGVPDTQKAAETLLNDWTGAKVSYHSKPPEQHKFPSHLSETAVAERLKEWGTEKLEQGNLNTIKNVKCPSMASSIVFHSTGPTDGVLDEGVKEPDEGQDEDEEVEIGSEEEDEEELELDEVKPKVKKVLPVDKASNGKSEEKTTGEQSTLQSQVVPVSIDFSSSKKDDDAYDFNTDFN